MAEFTDTHGIILQNLIDAGCDSALAEEYTRQILIGNTQTALNVLCKHRKNLLDEVHTNKKRIDCLDFLIYRIEKSNM